MLLKVFKRMLLILILTCTCFNIVTYAFKEALDSQMLFELTKDITGACGIFSDMVYNDVDDTYYYAIVLDNHAKTKTLVDMTVDSDVLVCQSYRIKIELPPHTSNVYSLAHIYMALKQSAVSDDWPELLAKVNIKTSTTEFERIMYMGNMFDIIREDSTVSIDEFSRDSITIRYAIENVSPEIKHTDVYTKEYMLDCTAYQRDDGTWTSDVVDNIDRYIKEANNQILIKSLVKSPVKSTISLARLNPIMFGCISVIIIVVLTILIARKIKRNSEDYV